MRKALLPSERCLAALEGILCTRLLIPLGNAVVYDQPMVTVNARVTADSDDVDPYAHHKHTPPRCDYALMYRSESR